MTYVTFYASKKNVPTLVSDVDVDYVQTLGFLNVHATGYISKSHYPRRDVHSLLHRLIMERILERKLEKGEVVDHINQDRRDNRRENLRVASYQENNRNRLVQKNNKLGTKGVTEYHSSKGFLGYKAQITINRKNIHIGVYSTIDEAKIAYEKAAKMYFGEFYNNNDEVIDYKQEAKERIIPIKKY